MQSSAAKHHRLRDDDHDSLTTYLESIRSYALLSGRAEVELARRIRAGDDDALQQLVCANLRFVVSVAKKYRHFGVPLADLINEGNIGLMRAARRFDETKGVKFISYAVWWIRQAVFQALAEHGHAVRVPVGRVVALRRERSNGHDSGVLGRSLSLDAPVGGGGDNVTPLADLIPDNGGAPPDEPMMDGDLVDATTAALEVLSPRELEVTRRYFGLDHEDAMTLEEIGGRLGVTRERVRQIKDRALRKIRRSRHAAALASFYAG
ncbi:MAG: sigma-70 family RNA polymerase sigma factor [Gemmatimonadaceae bacterium]